MKTNKKKTYYKVRKLVFVTSFLLIVGATFVVPYRYVTEAVKALQTEQTVEVEDEGEEVLEEDLTEEQENA